MPRGHFFREALHGRRGCAKRVFVDNADRILAALRRICQWMNDHRARAIPKNLAAGADVKRLEKAEAQLGFALPPELRALWSLHDGQRSTRHSFVGGPRIGDLELNLTSIKAMLQERELTLIGVENVREREARGTPPEDLRSDATSEELQSNQWLALATQESQSLVLSGVTGRVFLLGDYPLKLLAPSLTDWLEGYAADVEAGEYRVEGSSEDGYHLLRRDHEAEREAEEKAQRKAEELRFRREAPLLERMRAALAKKDESRSSEVLADARERNDTGAFEGSLALLFGSGLGPAFAATTLRPFLRTLALEPEQWLEVAIGGALLTNNAIRDVALEHRKDISAERFQALVAAAKSRS